MSKQMEAWIRIPIIDSYAKRPKPVMPDLIRHPVIGLHHWIPASAGMTFSSYSRLST